MDAEVVIVGGGPAGLSAALTLGQAFRDVVVLDEPRPAHRQVRGHLTRNGIDQGDYLALARAEAAGAGVTIERGRARVVRRAAAGPPVFDVGTDAGRSLRCRRVLLATGVEHRLPAVPGLAELWGSLVQNCPYCHDWGPRPAARALVIGSDPGSVRISVLLTRWARDVLLLADGPVAGTLPPGVRSVPRTVVEVRALPHEGVEAVCDDGGAEAGDVCFVDPPTTPRWHAIGGLPAELVGGELDPTGRSRSDGLWIVGTAASPHQRVVMAAGHGTAAAQAVNASLLAEDYGEVTGCRARRAAPMT